MKLLRRTIRKLLENIIVENQQYIQKLIPMITSDDFETVIQGIDLAVAIDMAEILEQEQQEVAGYPTPAYGARIYHKLVVRVNEPLFVGIQATKRSLNRDIFFLFIKDEDKSGRIEISHVESVRKGE